MRAYRFVWSPLYWALGKWWFYRSPSNKLIFSDNPQKLPTKSGSVFCFGPLEVWQGDIEQPHRFLP